MGGDFINLLSLWKTGKFIQEKKKSCMRVYQTCSLFFSYYYGNSSQFSLFSIQMMEKFYTYFPIFFQQMNQISWKSYLEILSLPREECYFYYHLLLFCGDDLLELRKNILTNLYSRI